MQIIEFLIYLTAIIAFCVIINVQTDFIKLSKRHRLTLILFVCFFIIGQVTKSSIHTYPFTYWGMYSQTFPNQTYNEYLIKLDEVHSFNHYPYEKITFTSPRAFMRKLQNVEQRLQGEEDRQLLYQTADRLATIYKKNNPSQIVQTFRINNIHITLTGDEQVYKTNTQTLFERDLE